MGFWLNYQNPVGRGGGFQARNAAKLPRVPRLGRFGFETERGTPDFSDFTDSFAVENSEIP